MMNKQKSTSLSLTKYVLLIPLVTVLVVTNHAEALAKKVEKLAPVNNVIQAVNQLSELKDRPEPLSPTKQKQTQEVILASVEKEAQKTESEKKNIANDNSDDEPFVVVEQMPQYPGGQEAMFKFLAQNLRYPVKAQQNGVQGMVILSFIVTKTGEINTIKIVRGVDPELDNEAMRVVKTMPIWIPGKQKGENVNVIYTLPIRFNLTGDSKGNGKVSLKIENNQLTISDNSGSLSLHLKDKNSMPLFIYDDDVVTSDFIEHLSANSINTMQAISPQKAIKLYGKQGENGVIILTVKEGTSRAFSKNAMVIIDGKESSMEILKGLNPEKILNTTVLKGQKAIESYGKKGSNGVVIVELKKE